MTSSEVIKTPAYRLLLNHERSAELYERIIAHLTKGRLYRDPDYTAKRLAHDLHTNTRYISAAIGNITDGNYNTLVNSMRLKDACKMMESADMDHMTIEEIGLLSGFSSRQAFYIAFRRIHGHRTPADYRSQCQRRRAREAAVGNQPIPES